MSNYSNRKYLQIIEKLGLVHHRYYLASVLVLFTAVSALVLETFAAA